MSNNYKILLYFLSKVPESLKVSLGSRNLAQNYPWTYQTTSKQNDLFTSQSSVTSEKTGTNKKPKSKNIDAQDIIEASAVVLEGLRQYTSFVNKHGISKHSSGFGGQDNDWKSSDVPPEVMKNANSTQAKPSDEIFEKEEIKPTAVKSTQFKASSPVVAINENKNYFEEHKQQYKLSENARERKVPANRASRFLSFTGLAFGLGVGAVEELAKRVVGMDDKKNDSILGSSIILSESNAHKIVDTLCQVRGAALKLGQMLSIQDNEILGPELQKIFERVRQSADYMPYSQMQQMLRQELGENWKERFKSFEEKPFAAASIGQVHRAELLEGVEVAVKIQYPGVAESIESDIKNVLAILKYANVFPDGLFIDHIMAYAKKELGWEVDYIREAECGTKYEQYVQKYCDKKYNFKVPMVYKHMSTKKVITTEMIKGMPVDKLANINDQEVKDSVSERILRLFLYELYIFNYMQTDPNWSNFFYDFETDTISLIDFGSSRSFDKEFVEKYLDIMKAAIDDDRQQVLDRSLDIGFLSGFETEAFKKAHVDSVMILGEAIRQKGPYDFGRQSVTKKIHKLVPIMLQDRLKPPPEEIYSLHRKLSGLFMLFTKLKARIDCRALFEDVTNNLNNKL